MTINLSLQQSLEEMACAAFRQLDTAGYPNQAREAVAMKSHVRDACEYACALLSLSDELRIEWAEVPS